MVEPEAALNRLIAFLCVHVTDARVHADGGKSHIADVCFS
jgi:hypothetical protein